MKNPMDRDVGFRYFVKEDGKVYETVATGVLDANGKMTYADRICSESGIDARGALTLTEFKLVDETISDESNSTPRFTNWLRGLGNRVVKRIDGMKHYAYYYQRQKHVTSSAITMDLENDAPDGASGEWEEDGVPLPFEFADWTSSIRRDAAASAAAGYDKMLEKARWTAEGVGRGLDLRNINGWDGLTYRGLTVYGFRDVPATLKVNQSGTLADGGWLDEAVTPAMIYSDIVLMVKAMNVKKIPGPYVLLIPESFRFRMAEPFFQNSLTGMTQSLYQKIMEGDKSGVPNVLNISEIKFVPEFDQLNGGGAPTVGEAYLLSLDPRWFNVLNYMPMTNFVIDLKGTISTKHRIVEGTCPLFRKDYAGDYGIVKLDVPSESE